MRAFLAGRDRDGRASRRLQQAREWVDGQSSTKMDYWEDLKAAELDRREQGATSIQAAYRGWEGRQIAGDRRARVEAATSIQRHYRGVLGRRRATEERWRQLQVVPTLYSLKLLKKRSREVQRSGDWVEYLDPDTGAFWYLQESTKRSTWNAPAAFSDSMTCVWDPWPVPYSSPLDKSCRRVFTNMAEFQSHRLHAHPWQCAACGQRNSSVTFPRCDLCDNTDGLPPPHARDGAKGAVGPPTRKDVGAGVMEGACLGGSGEVDASVGVSDGVLLVQAVSGRPSTSLRVCHQFSHGRCTLSTCPRAHPGIRDDARLERLKARGSRDVFNVTVCPLALANALGDGDPCPNGNRCKMYHPYVRPSTEDIVAKLYPNRNGDRVKLYGSGAVLKGTVVDEVFQGYGVYSWPSGDVFMGQWRDGLRHGPGTFRSADGREYVGTWEGNVREGYGVLTHPNGELYEGQFHRGKIHGVGFLSGAGGDCYQGEFCDGKPEGIGCFTRKNGDKYNGRIRAGEAHGLGVLAYASGEKYKGSFSNDMRSGKGVCFYPNGAKFAGQWERNMHQGFGVYVSPGGRERYVGQWCNSKRHGYGRYIFANGDVYDGDFQRGQACGQGVYRYAKTGGDAGDCYVGGWEADRRHGKGILRWANGSRYEGYWKAGAIEGKGVFQYGGGDCYRGEFHASKKHGRGVYVWANGNSYTGDFCWGAIAGFGELIYETTGHRYKGHWRDGRKHGVGTFW
eukprot:jgi/Undpi1/5034/HiC_scaffold_19.g08386.m1